MNTETRKQQRAGTTVFICKDTITTSEREVEYAIDHALRFAGYNEDDDTLPPAYVHETEDGKWAVSRDNRGREANPTSSELLELFDTEQEARAFCEKENAQNRPKARIVKLPGGIEFIGVEDLGNRNGSHGYCATIKFGGEVIQGRGWGESSFGRSGEHGAVLALEKAVRAAGFKNWRAS